MRVKRHVALCKVTEDSVVIAHIFHQTQDYARLVQGLGPGSPAPPPAKKQAPQALGARRRARGLRGFVRGVVGRSAYFFSEA